MCWHPRLAFTSCFQRMVLFPCVCERRGTEMWFAEQPQIERYKPEHRDQVAFCSMQRTQLTWSRVSKELQPVYHCTEYLPPKLVNWCSCWKGCLCKSGAILTYLPYSILFFSLFLFLPQRHSIWRYNHMLFKTFTPFNLCKHTNGKDGTHHWLQRLVVC